MPPLLGSDHNTLQLTLANHHIPTHKNRHRKIWLYKNADFDTANSTLTCLPTAIFSDNDVNKFWTEWYDVFMSVMAETIPTKQIKLKTKFLTSLRSSSISSRRNAASTSTLSVWAHPEPGQSTLKSETVSLVNKKVYFHHLADNICTPRDFWTQYHKLNPKHSRTPANIFHKGTEANSPTEKANLFNNFFTSCFTNSKLVPSVSHLPHPNPVLSSVTCSHEEVHKLLSTHKVITASGLDGISSVMLRGSADAISPALTTLFNLSLKLCTVPDQWKLSNIKPIFKSGDSSDVSHYRPISLLSLISKLLERCIHNRVMDFLTRHNLLSEWQFGFRPRSSIQDALLTITRDWH